MEEKELRFRQVHLDFHTSKDIPEIGINFNPEEFAETLEKARVNSITCFARGHHGWLYYDSDKFPERIHPNLVNKDLLKEQIEACHQRGIRVPIYITVQWDLYTAKRHPEWRVVSPDGKLEGTEPYEAGFYQSLCVNTPYREFLKEQTKEVLEKFPVDGIFFDIVQHKDCSCQYCTEGMLEKGLDPACKEDRMKYAKEMLDQFKLEMSDLVRSYDSDSTIFYNAGHIGPYVRESKSAYSHFELESLPSGGWGYLHFPLTVRYARTLGIDCLSHTGKFHTSWGDFHSFKNKEALEFECLRMLALNSKCEIGDQLPPAGKLSQPVYDLIGSVYSKVEKKEPWCREARAVTDIGVFNPEEFNGERVPKAAAGAVRILEESGHQFDILDTESDISNYKLLILPDEILVDDKFAAKLNDYLKQGGKLIATGCSGLNRAKDKFNLKSLGVRLVNDDQFKGENSSIKSFAQSFERGDYADYIVPEGEIGKGLPPTEHVMYMKGLEVESLAESRVLANVNRSYFDRTWEHFCSHRQTPSSGKVGYPGIVKNDNTIYFAHPIFTQYNTNAPRWCKVLMNNAIKMLLSEPILKHDGPSTMSVTLNEQEKEERRVVHLLHYIPERRSEEIDIIEDIIPLYEINLSIRDDKTVKKVTLVPEGKSLSFDKKDGRIEFTVPKIEGHQMVELAYN